MFNFHNIREMLLKCGQHLRQLHISQNCTFCLNLLIYEYLEPNPFCPVSALPVDPIGSCPCCLPAPMHNARILFTSGRTSPLVKNRGGRRLDGRVVTADPNRCMDYKG